MTATMAPQAASGPISGTRKRRIGTPSMRLTAHSSASVRSTKTDPTAPQVHRIAASSAWARPPRTEPKAAIAAISAPKLSHSSQTTTRTRPPA